MLNYDFNVSLNLNFIYRRGAENAKHCRKEALIFLEVLCVNSAPLRFCGEDF